MTLGPLKDIRLLENYLYGPKENTRKEMKNN